MFRFVAALRANARTDTNNEPFVCASWNSPGVFPSAVTPTASIAAIGPGKLIVVTRFVETGTVITTRSSRVTRWIASGDAARATVAANMRTLIGDFIFEVADSGGEAAVGGHVRVAEQAKPQFEIERLGERFLLKDAGADNLAGDCHQDFVLPGGKDINLRNLRFLVELFGAELDRLAGAMVLSLLQCRLQEHLPQQIRVIEILGVAFKERDGRKLGLLRVQ